jgi:hypothetical protein
LAVPQSLANAKADSQEWLSYNCGNNFFQADVFLVRNGGSITSAGTPEASRRVPMAECSRRK